MPRVVGYGRTVLVPELELERLLARGAVTPCYDENCGAAAHPRDRRDADRIAARYPVHGVELELGRAPRHGEP